MYTRIHVSSYYLYICIHVSSYYMYTRITCILVLPVYLYYLYTYWVMSCQLMQSQLPFTIHIKMYSVKIASIIDFVGVHNLVFDIVSSKLKYNLCLYCKQHVACVLEYLLLVYLNTSCLLAFDLKPCLLLEQIGFLQPIVKKTIHRALRIFNNSKFFVSDFQKKAGFNPMYKYTKYLKHPVPHF